MTTEATHVPEVALDQPKRAFIPRVGSALAFLPLGVYTVWHLWQNMAAWAGPRAWEQRVTAPHSPLGEVIMSTIVLLPLILHAAWGTRRVAITKSNLSLYPTMDNLKYILQRLSAIGLLGFLGAHIWLARLHPVIATGHHETFADLSNQMHHHMPTLIVYILGVLGTAYHFANGLATGGMTWGYAASPRAKSRMTFISITTFIVLTTMGLAAIYALWDAGAARRTEIRDVHSEAAEHPAD